VHDLAVIIDDADDFQLHGLPPARIINLSSPVKEPPPCPSTSATC
jgi:hypothetical protein